MKKSKYEDTPIKEPRQTNKNYKLEVILIKTKRSKKRFWIETNAPFKTFFEGLPKKNVSITTPNLEIAKYLINHIMVTSKDKGYAFKLKTY